MFEAKKGLSDITLRRRLGSIINFYSLVIHSGWSSVNISCISPIELEKLVKEIDKGLN